MSGYDGGIRTRQDASRTAVDVVKPINNVQGGTKHDQERPRLDLIPIEFLIGVGKSLGFGSKKYGDDNFRDGLQYRRLLRAVVSHAEMELASIELDEDSGCEHWMNAAASLAMYAYMKTHRPDMDNRPKYSEEEKKKITEMMYGKKS